MALSQVSSSEEWRSHLYFQAPLRNSFHGDFRLLTIQSRKYASTAPSFNATTTVIDDDSLHCILKLANLKKSPSFNAVSHACSSHGAAKTILINGAPVPVSNELLLALQHVQRQDEPVTVWVDALCINSADLAEKSAQMSQLPGIFAASERTIIWLGQCADGSVDAMSALSRIYDESQQQTVHRRTESWGNKLLSGWKGSHSNHNQIQTPESPKEDLDQLLALLKPSFSSLLQRPYWSKAWSLQETAFSAKCDIVCGKEQMDASHFLTATKSLETLMNKSTISKWLASGEFKIASGAQSKLDHIEPAAFSHSPAVQLLTSRSDYRRQMGSVKPTERSLLLVLQRHLVRPADNDGHEHRLGEGEDPCEAIRSLMGLATDLQGLGLALDYARDYNGLCHDISAALLKQSASPLQLCSNQSSVSDLPSWVIRWTKARRSPLQLSPAQRPFTACGPADDRFYRADINPLGQLVLKAVLVDTVKKTCVSPQNTSQPDEAKALFSQIKSLWGDSLAMESSPYKGEQTMDALARIPIADMQMQNQNDTSPPCVIRAGDDIVLQYMDALEELSEKDNDDSATPSTVTQSPAKSTFSRSKDYLAAVERMVGWAPFITETGYIGLAASGSKLSPGHVIAIPYGSSVPFAMEHKGETHRLLGEVYLHGVMDGEFMKVHRKETSLRLI
ncbi:Heterokaryon incompatibility protein 6 [Apiospora sp. TS-2023a]